MPTTTAVSQTPARHRWLISAEELANHQKAVRPGEDDSLALFDCRFVLQDPAAGEGAYPAGHLPGARYLHLDRDLSGPIVPGVTGRHPLPSPEELDRRMGQWGLTPATPVVAYDDSGGAFAARLWWLLRWAGLSNVRVLDGGLAAWQRSGLPLEAGIPPPRPAVAFQGLYPKHAVVEAEELVTRLDDPQLSLVDARAEARYRGEIEPIDPVAGHIPGAVCLPHDQNLAADGRFLDANTLRKRFTAINGSEVVLYCGSGVTACHNALAMAIAGLPEPRLYAGSWSEWITNPARPVTR